MTARHVVLAGGSGFVGRSLARTLLGRGCRVTVLTRSAAPLAVPGARAASWDGRSPGAWAEAVDGADAVVNLAGRNVNCRPSARNGRELAASRRDAVLALAAAMDRARRRPGVFVQCGAVGIYGDTSAACDEQAPAGEGFLAAIAGACEDAVREAGLADTRTVVLRLGVVLGRDGGALPLLARLARCCLGGAAGSGGQFLSWIHARDLDRIFLHVLDQPGLAGVFNAVAPAPARNADFMRALRAVLGRPWSPPVPAAVLRAVARVLGTNPELVLAGQRCLPRRLLEAGFRFEFDGLDEALRDLLGPA